MSATSDESGSGGDFLTKPFRKQELLNAVRQAVARDRAAAPAQQNLRAFVNDYEKPDTRRKKFMKLVDRGG